MKKAILFPGQGSQKTGMGNGLMESGMLAKERLHLADEILGFSISDLLIHGTAEDLQKTSVTQPSVFLVSIILAELGLEIKDIGMVAGHSLGEFTALVFSGVLSFEDGLRLIYRRAEAMQAACELNKGTMAAIIGLAETKVIEICEAIPEVVVPANYNAPDQIVVSGEVIGVEKAINAAIASGARLAKMIPVGGAFHSPLMLPAKIDLGKAIEATVFKPAKIPVYQNSTALPATDPDIIKTHLLEQLIKPVKWVQVIEQMVHDGASHFMEIGPGKVLTGLNKRIFPEIPLVNIQDVTNFDLLHLINK